MHLLVVEDDVRLGPLLTRLLREDRHVVELTTRGGEALDLAAGLDGLDAVVLDIGLPDMSGLDVARQLRRRKVAAPILMLTARDAVSDRVAGLDAGADDYLVKPFAYEELAARLRASPAALPAHDRGRGDVLWRDRARRAAPCREPGRDAGGPQRTRVRPPRDPPPPPGRGTEARPAPRPRLALRGGGHPEHRRCLRRLPPSQAGPVGARPNRDGPGRRLPAGPR